MDLKPLLTSNCWEKVSVGYVSTFATIDRLTNTLVRVSYYWHRSYSDDKPLLFNSFKELNDYIDRLRQETKNKEYSDLQRR